MAKSNPILAKLRAALDEMCGTRIERVVLDGSRARGDARSDSDYGMVVFLKDIRDAAERWAEADKIADAATALVTETGAVIHAMPEAERFLDKSRECLANARTSLGVNLTNDAGRVRRISE